MKIVDIGVGKIGVATSLADVTTGADAVLVASTLCNVIDLNGEVCRNDFCRKCKSASYKFGCPVMCGCTTSLGEIKHISVFSFSKGKLADIADRTININSDCYSEGNTVKVLRCPKLTIGLLIDTDVLLAGNWKKIAPYCDAVCSVAFKCTEADLAYIPTYSSLFDLPYVVAYADGGLIYKSNK